MIMDADKLNQLTQDTLCLMMEWGVSLEKTAIILGFPENTSNREMRRYFNGYVFPKNPEVIERAERVLYLNDVLRTTYPTNQKMPAYWMKTPHKRFGGRTPLDRISDGDKDGLVAVIALLDCSYAWSLNS